MEVKYVDTSFCPYVLMSKKNLMSIRFTSKAITMQEQRILELRKLLHDHNYNYYVKNAPTISDQEFDQLMDELLLLEAQNPLLFDPNSPTQRVGSDLSGDFEQVTHQRPMLSLGNTYNREEVAAFYERVRQGLEGEAFDICCELKFDGLSISLHYEEGKLVRAVTRGDGVVGDDVTRNVRTIRSIPLLLPEGGDYPEAFEIRGEILMPWQSFETLNQQREARGEALFANPRNAASGTLKSKNSAVVASRKLDAYLYELYTPEETAEGHFESLQKARSWGFKISEATCLAHSLDDIYNFIDNWDTMRRELPVATDGIVLKVNNYNQRERLGFTAKSPRWAIAYKFQAERGRTLLNEVTFQVGRTGAVTPVANMDPVQLAGTIVKRASLHNADIINQLDLHLGDYVYVEKAGEIIPQIVGVDTEARSFMPGPKVVFRTTCPECGTPLVRYEGEAAHYCPNDTQCPPQIKGRIEHFISREAMNIDSLGPETVASLFERGILHNVADLYTLTLDQLTTMEGNREKSARRLLEGIAESKNVTFDRVLYALGIRFVGKVVAKLLARQFKNIDALQAASLEQLLETEGVGEIIAQSVKEYFSKQDNLDLLERLREAGLQMELPEIQLSSTLLEGMSIVISGTFTHHSREEYKAIIEANGGKNVSSISKKTTFILAGENMGPSKLEKAQKLGVEIVDEETFLERVKMKE